MILFIQTANINKNKDLFEWELILLFYCQTDKK